LLSVIILLKMKCLMPHFWSKTKSVFKLSKHFKYQLGSKHTELFSHIAKTIQSGGTTFQISVIRSKSR
jgi:hypothetical protein